MREGVIGNRRQLKSPSASVSEVTDVLCHCDLNYLSRTTVESKSIRSCNHRLSEHNNCQILSEQLTCKTIISLCSIIGHLNEANATSLSTPATHRNISKKPRKWHRPTEVPTSNMLNNNAEKCSTASVSSWKDIIVNSSGSCTKDSARLLESREPCT